MSEEKTVVRILSNSGFALKGLCGEHKDKVYPIGAEFNVGREQDNDLIVNEGFVSRYHAQLRLIAGQLSVTDNHSSNGTCINGNPIEGAVIVNYGDTIKFDVIEFAVVEYVKAEEESISAHDETKLRLEAVSEDAQLTAQDEMQAETKIVNTTESVNIETASNATNQNSDNQSMDEKNTVASFKNLEIQCAKDSQKTVFFHAGQLSDSNENNTEKKVQSIDTSNQKTIVASGKIEKANVVETCGQALHKIPATAQQDEKKTIVAPVQDKLSPPKDQQSALSSVTVSDNKQKPTSFTASSDDTMNMDEDVVAKIKNAAAAQMSVELLGLSVPVANRTFKLNKPLQTIGRSPFNDIILKSSSVSSQHAEIEKVGDDWIVRDLDSSNGTYVNDNVIEQCRLYHNDSLIFGEVELTFDPKGLVPVPETSDREYDLLYSQSSSRIWLVIGAVLLVVIGVAVMLIK